MTWTWNPAMPLVRDAVRLDIGDITETEPQLADETLDALLGEFPNRYRAAAEACRRLAALYTRRVDRQIQTATLREGDLQKHYLTLAATLDRRALDSLVPSAGGLSVAGKRLDTDDTDVVPPFFTRTLHDATLGAPVGAGAEALSP